MPAAAVIPAPIVYIKVVAVKKLVVQPLSGEPVLPRSVFGVGAGKRGGRCLRRDSPSRYAPSYRFSGAGGCVGQFTLKKFECSKQAILQ